MGEKLVIYYKAGNEGFEEWWSGSWVLKTKPVGKVGEIPKVPTGQGFGGMNTGCNKGFASDRQP